MSEKPPQQLKVLVVGAGVAGMTAAHELAERGFEVVVVDAAKDPRNPRLPRIGGVAASQFRRAPSGRGSPSKGLHVGGTLFRQAPELIQFRVGDADLGGQHEKGKPFLMFGWPAFPYPPKRGDKELPAYLTAVAKAVAASDDDEDLVVMATYVEGKMGQPSDAEKESRRVADELFTSIFQKNTDPCPSDPEEIPEGEDPRMGGWRSSRVLTVLNGTLGKKGSTHTRLVRIIVAIAEIGDRAVGSHDDYVTVVVRQDLLPGEHGYRFFPSFYRNLLDTLDRIPVVEHRPRDPLGFHVERALQAAGDRRARREAASDSRFTVRDNLKSVELHAIATQDGQPPAVLPRSNDASVRQVFAVIDAMQRSGLDVPVRDMIRWQLRLLRFVTSCADRRAELADQSFLDFVTAGGASEQFRRAVERWPQALVGLRADTADARTYAAVLLQLAKDQLRPPGYRDGTLNGPTTDAWFDPWRRHLERTYDVRFEVATLTCVQHDVEGRVRGVTLEPPVPPKNDDQTFEPDFIVFAMELPAWLRVHFLDLGGSGPSRRVDAVDWPERHPLAFVKRLVDGYKPAAGIKRERTHLKEQGKRTDVGPAPQVPVGEWNTHRKEAYKLLDSAAEDLPKKGAPSHIAWKHLQRRVGLGAREGTTDRPWSSNAAELPFRQYAGIQFFLARDHAVLRGHIYFADSAWSLSSISQGQFRQPKPTRYGMYAGVLSVIIGAWDVSGPVTGKPAWACTRDEIAKEVWWQVLEGLRGVDVLPEDPVYYHLDEAIEGEPGTARRNLTPFLVNDMRLAGQWPQKPGKYCDYGKAVFCGTWLDTHTRLVTMESANESARHAVNAVLRCVRNDPRNQVPVGNDCPVYDLECDEFPDLAPLVALDQELFTRGLPHFMDILDVEDAILPLLDQHEPAAGRTLFQTLQEYVRTQGDLGAVVGAYLLDLLGR